ncbi:uncharacterized protein TRIADDRAFT_60605 [Trichoplax adhaerens]|uniref:SCA7 domain-containing protein n=1 Tax=Trichoplax adhaerens TaxID=10228 RepID=B3S8N8_TRIAD|nr:hypothetical protein TRIADDRAFT_60605 [Trichoplax adhaerens]EDV20987.1 hypothetical protein TRIADDRAFT_60605 [Trichoplax adhaerens]|eukprot:XP_002116631.1 hypothetical protein TRIADDRAFT_60605 [Trichoplax adhaerens]
MLVCTRVTIEFEFDHLDMSSRRYVGLDSSQQASSRCNDHNELRNMTGDQAEKLSQYFYETMVDEITLGTCYDVDRSVQLGYFNILDCMPISKDDEISDSVRGDIFSEITEGARNKSLEVSCPECQRTITASRFAPHLEKCLGMGRISRRIASKKLNDYSEDKCDYSDNDDGDTDWKAAKERKAKRLRRDKSGRSSNKNKPSKNKGNLSNVKKVIKDGNFEVEKDKKQLSLDSYSAMSIVDREEFLNKYCGVISEHTGRICIKTLRCPQHTEEQRSSVRDKVFGSTGMSSSSSSMVMSSSDMNGRLNNEQDDIHIVDIVNDDRYAGNEINGRLSSKNSLS